MARKPTIYLDTTIPTMMFYYGHDILTLGRHVATREWWDGEREHFQLLSSVVTENELVAGDYPWQKDALALARRIPYLPFTAEMRERARFYLRERIVPDTKGGDALQLAFATVYQVDYLLSWNHAHLANADTQARLRELCQREAWRCPFLVTPDTIPKVALGQQIRRRD
jgi:hypothetical protein